MIWRILVIHDLHRMIKDFRLVILLVCGIVLFSLNGFMFAVAHTEATSIFDDLRLSVTKPWSVNQVRGDFESMSTNGASPYPRPSTIATELYVPPNTALFLAEGRANIGPDSYDIRAGGVITPFYEQGRNTLLDLVAVIDWSYITIMLFAVFAILFGHSAISREREDGTLMQVLSNPVKRPILLMSRYCSVMSVLLIPFFLGGMISILVYLVLVPDIVTSEFWIRIILFICVAISYLSVFCLMSLFCSSFIRKSSLSLLLLLLVWVVFLVFPQVSDVMVSFMYKDRNVSYFKEQQRELITANEERIEKMFLKPESPDFVGYFQSSDELVEAFMPHLNAIHTELQENYDVFLDTVLEKAMKSRQVRRVSPTGLFLNMSECIAGSDIIAEKRFRRAVKAYSILYDSYVLEKTGSIITKTATALNANILQAGIIIRDGRSGISILQSRHSAEYEGDKSDFPGFEYRSASIRDIVRETLPDTIGLILWNLVLVLGGLFVFTRADVR